jgi:hypothetical protein
LPRKKADRTPDGRADLRARPFAAMIPVVRSLLAVALVLQFSGVPSAWAKPCVMAAARGEHACCLARLGGAATHVSGSCGCQMTPVPAGQTPSPVSTAPEATVDHGVPVADASVAFAPALALDIPSHAQSPPGCGRDGSLSHLSGGGFRC